MHQVLQQVRQELALSSSPADVAMMEDDVRENFESYYLQEHHQDLDTMLANGQTAHQLLHQGQQPAVEVASSEEDTEFRWVP